MTGVLTSTATSGTRKTVLTLLAALSLLAAAAIVYAATAKSDFKVSAAPASRTLTPGGAATYNVKIKRIKGFSGSVKLSISNLPGGTTATWKAAKPACKRGKRCPKPKANIVAPGASSAVLTLKTSSGTPVGAAKPTITGASGHLKHTAPITLNL